MDDNNEASGEQTQTAKEILLQTPGEFYWLWGKDWLIETTNGNYHWSNGQQGGDNTIRPYKGSLQDLCTEMGVDNACPKGNQLIGIHTGDLVQVIEA